MIVVVAAGSQARMPPVHQVGGVIPYIRPSDVLLEPGMPITAGIVQTIQGDLTGGSMAYDSVFALGISLFAVTLVLNVVSDLIAERYREVY